MSQVQLDPSMLEACVRDVLNLKAPRSVHLNKSFKHYSCHKLYANTKLKLQYNGTTLSAMVQHSQCYLDFEAVFVECPIVAGLDCHLFCPMRQTCFKCSCFFQRILCFTKLTPFSQQSYVQIYYCQMTNKSRVNF